MVGATLRPPTKDLSFWPCFIPEPWDAWSGLCLGRLGGACDPLRNLKPNTNHRKLHRGCACQQAWLWLRHQRGTAGAVSRSPCRQPPLCVALCALPVGEGDAPCVSRPRAPRRP